eukprot:3427574-Ditylum_brightwellii.AAC.1
MATCNANESVPPTGGDWPHEREKLYAKAPVMPTMDNGPNKKMISQWRYNYCWRLTFPVPENKDISPRKKFATLLSMIGQFLPLTVLNTWADADLLQGLTNGKYLPYVRDNLVAYCSHIKKKTRLETMWNLAFE